MTLASEAMVLAAMDGASPKTMDMAGMAAGWKR